MKPTLLVVDDDRDFVEAASTLAQVRDFHTSGVTSLADARWAGRRSRPGPEGFVGDSPPMCEVYRQIRQVGPAHANVLIVGESGTGKEISARAIHTASGRTGPFVAMNCGAVSPDLLASQLFGHERGSFTGAVRQHKGCFEQAQGGTLFLDEIAEMPMGLQAHLLRVLETRTVHRVGASVECALDVRMLAATNRDPEAAIDAGLLREDLYYRLAEFVLVLPPLRERMTDIPLLAEAALDALNQSYGKQKTLAPDAIGRLMNHHWPGNVRELRNRLHQAYLLAETDAVSIGALPRRDGSTARTGSLHFPVGTRFDVVMREMLQQTLAHFDGDKTRTADALGVSIKTIYNHLQRSAGPSAA